MQITCDKFHDEWQKCKKSIIIAPTLGTMLIATDRKNSECHELFNKWSSCLTKSKFRRRNSFHTRSGVMCKPSEK